MEATLLVLAGGESRRMGRPKPWIEVGDTVLLRYVVERLAPAFSEVMVSFGEPEQMEQLVPYRVVFDRKRSAGPLAGLEAGLEAARNDALFAVACDMPYVTQAAAELSKWPRPSGNSRVALLPIEWQPQQLPVFMPRTHSAWLFISGGMPLPDGPVPGNSLLSGTCIKENQYPAG